jgi:catechol 2,3-dioxygenase-like lactoylglutathione lyase family enzyme
VTTAFAITSLDHLVLTVADIDKTCDFYSNIMGMHVARFGAGRTALHFGTQKINLHQRGQEFDPKAMAPTAGSADLCFLTNAPLAAVTAHLHHCGIAIVEGPVRRTGATGPIISVYIRDPDQNLIEISVSTD